MRSGAVQNAVDIPKRWPLINKLQSRSPAPPINKDARLINCYAELDPEDEEYWIYKRVGFSPIPSMTILGATGRGIYTAPNGQLYSVFGNNVYNGLSPAPIGAVDGTHGARYSFDTLVTAVGSSVVMQDQWAAYAIPQNTNIPAIIMPPNTAQLTIGVVTLDGVVYLMDTISNIWGSAVNDPTTWNALNVIQASSNADAGVAIAKQLSYIVALKQYTSQVFYDADAPPPGSALGPVPDSQVAYGCLFGESVQNIDDLLLWVTSNKTISPQIVLMENLTPKIVSTPAVDRILKSMAATSVNYPTVTGINSWVLKLEGHRLYGLTCVALNVTLVYDIDQRLWYLWADANGNYFPVFEFAYIYAVNEQGLHLGQMYLGGNIYQADDCYTFSTDSGTIFPVDIYTPNFDGSTVRRKMLRALYPVADQISGSTLQMRHSDDDYQSWSNFRTCDLSLNKPRFRDCGTFQKRRALNFRHQCATPFRIKAVDMQMELGTL